MKGKIIVLSTMLFFMAGISNVLADIATEMDTVVVTATRIAQHNYKIAGNVTVITKEEIEASNAQSVPDILKEAPLFAMRAKSSALQELYFGHLEPSKVSLDRLKHFSGKDLRFEDLESYPHPLG